MEALKFEEKMARLKEIVTVLENGDLDLDAAVKIYCEGAQLANECKSILKNAEQKVKVYVEGDTSIENCTFSSFEVE